MLLWITHKDVNLGEIWELWIYTCWSPIIKGGSARIPHMGKHSSFQKCTDESNDTTAVYHCSLPMHLSNTPLLHSHIHRIIDP